MGLLVNKHGFMQLLRNQYFEVLVDHKAIEYMVKNKTETLTMRLKTLLLKLSEYTNTISERVIRECQSNDFRCHDLQIIIMMLIYSVTFTYFLDIIILCLFNYVWKL